MSCPSLKDPLHAANCLGGRGLEALAIGAGEASLDGAEVGAEPPRLRSFHGDHVRDFPVTTC